MNKGLLIGGAAVLVIVAFVAGAFAGPQLMRTAGIGGQTVLGAAGGPPNGGPMANLTDAERQQVQSMSESERQKFFQEKMGGQMPAGAPGGRGGVVVEGQVVDVATDSATIKTTSGGSQTVYLDDTTVVGHVEKGSDTAIASGDNVVVAAQPEADNVVTAKAVIVK